MNNKKLTDRYLFWTRKRYSAHFDQLTLFHVILMAFFYFLLLILIDFAVGPVSAISFFKYNVSPNYQWILILMLCIVCLNIPIIINRTIIFTIFYRIWRKKGIINEYTDLFRPENEKQYRYLRITIQSVTIWYFSIIAIDGLLLLIFGLLNWYA